MKKRELDALLERAASRAGYPYKEGRALARALLAELNELSEKDRLDALGMALTDELAAPGRVRLVSLANSGEDETSYGIDGDVIIGREGDLAFPEDDYLSPSHARLWFEDDALWLRDLDSINGTHVKLMEPYRLDHGDVLIFGRQVMKFTCLSDARQENPVGEDGVRRMASPPPIGSAQLTRQGTAGESYESYQLDPLGQRIGRVLRPDEELGEGLIEADIQLEDRFISQNHMKVWRDDRGWMLEDLDSGNGTWIRLTSDRRLEDGEFIFLGKQLLRIEFIIEESS